MSDNLPFDLSAFPHSTLRPTQADALSKIVQAINGGERFIFAQLPTGTGKSLIAWALGINQSVTVLVNTHALGEQYAREYGFEFLPGRHVFPCIHPEKIKRWKARELTPTAYDCHYSPMTNCEYASECPYIVAKQKALSARRLCVTYQYAIRSEQIRKRPGVLVLDECHEAIETLLDVTESEFNRLNQVTFDLAEFPYSREGGYGEDGKGGAADDQALADVQEWLERSLRGFGQDSDETDSSPDGARVKRMKEKLKGLQTLLDDGEWFLRSSRDGLYVKALSGELGAAQLFQGKQAIVCMSATLGDPAALAREMGIQHYTFLDYPHPVPVEHRPVFDLHVPKLTAIELKNNPELYRVQALIIARWIKKLDPTWRGLIVSTSNYKVQQLRALLGADPVVGPRLYIPRASDRTVGERVGGFLRNPRQGLISIDTIQGWGHGLSLFGDLARFTVVAGVPHKNPTDAYFRARIARPGGRTYENAMAYLAVVQADGRAKRGERDEQGNWVTSVSALADGSCTVPTAMRFYPGYFKEAIR